MFRGIQLISGVKNMVYKVNVVSFFKSKTKFFEIMGESHSGNCK